MQVMLSFSVFMLLIAETMPPTSENAPLAGVYLTVIMGMSGASIVMSVLVLNIFVRGRDVHRPPRALKTLCHYMAKGLFYKMKGRSFSWTAHDKFTAEHRGWFPASGPGPKAGGRPQAAACSCAACAESNVLTNGYMNVELDELEQLHSFGFCSPDSKRKGLRQLADSSLSLDQCDSPQETPTCRLQSSRKRQLHAAAVARRLAEQLQTQTPSHNCANAHAHAHAHAHAQSIRRHDSVFQLVELLRASNHTRKATVYQGNLLDLESSHNRYHVKHL